MELVIFTSLTSLIILLVILWFIKRVYRRIKPGLDTTLRVVDSAATAFGSCTKSALQSINNELIEFNANAQVEQIKSMLENNDKSIESLDKLVSDKTKHGYIKNKSLLELNKRCSNIFKELNNYKIEALKANDTELFDRIENVEDELKTSQKKILSLNNFVMMDIVLNEFKKTI